MATEDMIGYFDEKASGWDRTVTGRTIRLAEAVLERAGVRGGASVLDVGAGTGLLVPLLKKRGTIRYVGLEVSKEMIKVFKGKFPSDRIVLGDFEHGPDLETQFDFVIVFNTFPLFGCAREAFRVAHSYAKRGALFVIAHTKTRDELTRWRRERNVREPALPTDDEIRTYCEEAGFTIRAVDDDVYFYCAVCSS